MENFQYIQTTRELMYQECSGRYTTLEKGVPGVILDENNIEKIIDIKETQKKDCLKRLNDANNFDETLALVQGRVCNLNKNDFYKCEEPKIYIVPVEIF